MDENADGDIDEGETQECGGEVFGLGGHDGNNAAESDALRTNHSSAGFDLNHQLRTFHWTHPEGEDRKIIIRASTVGTWTSHLTNVLNDWGQSSEFFFVTQQAETSSEKRESCPMPGMFGRVRVCNFDYDFDDNVLGKAKVRTNPDGHIQRAKARLDDDALESVRRPLLCQEIGHTIGLDHRPQTSSCMHRDASEAAVSPDAHDYEQLVDQTHFHGGESLTGGADSNLDTGGGQLDGCLFGLPSLTLDTASEIDSIEVGCVDWETHVVELDIDKARDRGWILRLRWLRHP